MHCDSISNFDCPPASILVNQLAKTNEPALGQQVLEIRESIASTQTARLELGRAIIDAQRLCERFQRFFTPPVSWAHA